MRKWKFRNLSFSLRTKSISKKKKSFLLKWLPWEQSPNPGIRFIMNRCGIKSVSLSIFKSWKNNKWQFHFGPAWKA